MEELRETAEAMSPKDHVDVALVRRLLRCVRLVLDARKQACNERFAVAVEPALHPPVRLMADTRIFDGIGSGGRSARWPEKGRR
ncbi:hypothetical protein [Streptosporangium sp. CA-115845]|uniref:hypothetical protein n=1 Tax=Streptosporangium sp. CA-115845 TaxID=3240071 RepID=UPI003D8A310A